MISFPHCKINLGLHVLSKRSDGYHNIETCFYPVALTDILEVIRSSEFSFAQSGLKVEGEVETNLCVKAFRLLQSEIGSAKIHLHKIIPMGAGLGGGSSDAAFMLRMLNEVFNLKISNEQLKSLALQLGSDCPFFIDDQPMIGSGRGEVLSPMSLSLKGYYLVLVKPEVHVSTAEAYLGIEPKHSEKSIQEIVSLPMTEWRHNLTNDFEKTIFKSHPVIKDIKDELYARGAVYASMSGSGASVFGIFEKPVDFSKDFGAMFYWSGELK